MLQQPTFDDRPYRVPHLGTPPRLSTIHAHEHLAQRTLLAIVGFTIVGVAYNMWQSIVSIPFIGVGSVLTAFLGLLVIASAFVCHEATTLRRLEWAALGIAVLCLVGWGITALYFTPSYGTDEVAFEQYAAQLVTQGINPYGANLAPALDLFRVPIQYATYTMSGGLSAGLAYPDLSLLAILPLLLVGIISQAAIIVNIFFFITTMIVAFLLLPKSYRLASVILCVGIPILFGYAVAGVNTVLFMPFLIVAAARWDRYDERRGWRAWIAPLAYGVACSVQQLPWFIAPFLLAGIFIEAWQTASIRRAAAACARYAAIAAGTFLTVNLPFIVWGPRQWLHGIMLPMTQHAIPYGQGLVDLSEFFHLGGGRVAMYSDTAMLLIGAMLVLYVWQYRLLRYLTFFMPALVLFFASRSLAEYFSNLIIVSCVGALTIKRFDGEPIKIWRWLIPLAFLPAAATLTLAVASPAPLRIHVTGFRTDGQLRAVQEVDAVVTNASDTRLTPHFAVNFIGQMTTFWIVSAGPATLAPHQTAQYTLIAPNLGSMPPVTAGFQVQVVTPAPETINISETVIPEQMSTQLTPGYVDHPMFLGQTVHFSVQLRDHYGAPIHQANVPVALGQIIYDQIALVDAESQINDANIGETPVIAETDANGIAHFTVRDTSFQGDPIYYESWIAQPNMYPYGYSSIVIVNWAQPPAVSGAQPARHSRVRHGHALAIHHVRAHMYRRFATAHHHETHMVQRHESHRPSRFSATMDGVML